MPMRQSRISATAILVSLVIVAVLATSAVLGATPQDDSNTQLDVTTGNSTPGQLNPPDYSVGSEGRHEISGDLSASLIADEQGLRAEVQERRYEQNLQNATENFERASMTAEYVDVLAQQAVTVRKNRQRTITAYDRGQISSVELFRELTRTYAEASEIESQIEYIEDDSMVSLSPSNEDRISRIQSRLIFLDGRVSGDISTTLTENEPGESIYIKTSSDGVVFGDIDGNTYFREAMLWSERGEEGDTNQFVNGGSQPLVGAYQRAQEVYTWVMDDSQPDLSISAFGDLPIYQVDMSHEYGHLTTYFDGRTTNVFYEEQSLRLSDLPTQSSATNTSDSLSVRANVTEAGPVSVTVTNETTESPALARVDVDGEFVGMTDTQGRLWWVGTPGNQTIAANADNASVAVTVEA